MGAPIPTRKQIFDLLFHGVEIRRGPRNENIPWCSGCYAWAAGKDLVRLYGPDKIYSYARIMGIELLAHELGHILDNRLGDDPSAHLRAVIPIGEGETETGRAISAHAGLGVMQWSKANYFELWADAFASWSLEKIVPINTTIKSQNIDWSMKLTTFMSRVVTQKVINWQEVMRWIR